MNTRMLFQLVLPSLRASGIISFKKGLYNVIEIQPGSELPLKVNQIAEEVSRLNRSFIVRCHLSTFP